MKDTMLKALLSGALLLTGGAMAQNGSMSGMDMSTHTSSMPGMNMGMSKMMNATMPVLEKLSGKAFDRAFLSMMVPHHQAAVNMAKAVLPLSKDASVKSWASVIIKSQQQEITTMTGLLGPLGGSDQKMAAMMDDMKGMGAMIRSSKSPDVSFVQNMLPHHSSAIDMAKLALQKSSNPAVLKLAQTIVLAQAREMYDFRSWLLKN